MLLLLKEYSAKAAAFRIPNEATPITEEGIVNKETIVLGLELLTYDPVCLSLPFSTTAQRVSGTVREEG